MALVLIFAAAVVRPAIFTEPLKFAVWFVSRLKAPLIELSRFIVLPAGTLKLVSTPRVTSSL